MFTGDNTMFGCPSSRGELVMEKRWKSNHTESAPNCPRCASSNTKFCYYNNYSLSQPRYFCKGCRRYWTKGGSLRNVPVGGGCRKSRKSKSARLADQRSGLSYQMPSPGSTGDDHDQSNGNTSGANIDLAAVFAKFLNQDSTSNEAGEDTNVNVIDHQESSSSGVSYNSLELGPNSFDLETMILECQTTPYDHHFIDDGAQIPPISGMDHGESVQDHNLFLQNCDSLNLQAILGDEEETSNLPNFEWQSILQFQDFGSSNDDDDGMKIPSNLAAEESWSSFDLSGYEIFPRHWS